MNDIEKAHIEQRITNCRDKVKAAGRCGNATLARAYAEELSFLLKQRSPDAMRKEEEIRGLA